MSGRRASAMRAATAVLLVAALAAPLAAQDNADCLGCHADPTVAVGPGGGPGPRLVAEDALEGSVHADLDCIACHVDLTGSDGLHKPDVAPASCSLCHADEADVSPRSDRIHGPALAAKGLTVGATCASCHGTHDVHKVAEPASRANRTRVAETCGSCHTGLPEIHAQVIAKELWETPERKPACSECHVSHAATPARADGLASADCQACHARTDLLRADGSHDARLHVDAAAYAGSVHAGVGCAQCHADVHPSKTRPCETAGTKVNCAACHAGVVDQYQHSIHGTEAARGDPDAPRCTDCHAVHETKSQTQPDSPLAPRNVPALCAQCHRAGEKAAKRIQSDVPDIVASYGESTHGRALRDAGLIVAATCVSCHTAHGQLPPSDPKSTVAPANVASTCGQCHQGILQAYQSGVHWSGNTKTDQKLPTCNDCHTSHTISRVGGADFRQAVTKSCGSCHLEQQETFLDTLHGKATKLGSSMAAKCYDCHGTHAIRAPSDQASTLSVENKVATCSQCHSGAHAAFTSYLTHATTTDRVHYPWLFWTFVAMTSLLVGTLVVALLHSAAWLVRLLLTRAEWAPRKAALRATREGWFFRRFTRLQRAQHLLLMLAFFDLALTGMALKFSGARWARALAPVLGGPDAMRVLHRSGALVLIGVFAWHVLGLLRRRNGARRKLSALLSGPESLMFGRRDWNDFRAQLRWFAGRGPRPRFDRYTYWEKFDYMAVFWGVAVIGLTGLMLWFPVEATRLLPGWFLNVAGLVHGDEALLAVVFIFTIHFFNSHFRPDKFPMDMVMFTGRVPLEELRHERPLEVERLEASGELQRRLTGPLPADLERSFRIFGFLAIGLGVAIVIVIVVALASGAS